MGNNTSQIRRLSIAYNESNVRKSSTSKQAQNNLDEEFSDLILHEVKKDELSRDHQLFNRTTPKRPPLASNQFLNDLIEDEFNELNDLIETDETELTRNIIPNEGGSDDTQNDQMDVDETMIDTPNESLTPTPDLSRVDFTKVMPQNGHMNVSMNNPPLTNSNLSQSISSRGDGSVPVEIKWVDVLNENIQKVSIIGSFSNWRNIIRLRPSSNHPNEYVVTIRLPLGVHKLLYIVNNEYRVSDQLPTATDQEGIFFNWFEVLDELHLFNHSQNQPDRIVDASTKYDANIISAGQNEIDRIQKKSNSFLAKISKEEPNVEHVEYMADDDHDMNSLQNELLQEHQQQQQQQQQQEYAIPPQPIDIDKPTNSPDKQGQYILLSDNNSSSFLLQRSQEKIDYSSDIPEIFVNYNYFKSQNTNFELPEPPQLPAHLNNVLLNKISNSSANSSNSHQPQPQPDSMPMPQMDQFRPPSANYTTEPLNKRPPLRRADSSYYASNQEAYHLSIPNHVILNHLMTTSIRNDVLTVACITRYSGKFVTQIMHSPATPFDD